MPLELGQRLAHYRIERLIGQGGMGAVYLAQDSRLQRKVALKVLPAEMAASPERLRRFRREAKALAALDHPGVVTVHSVEEADGVHFLTMQLVEGQPLDRLIPADGLGVEEILEIATGLADALAAAHEKGIVHRDLKPANVMVTADGRVKVLDFGLARMTRAQPAGSGAAELSTESLTREDVVMGTLPYMSPEQVSGQPVDRRSDIFSLGVVLYEMATGQRPFRGSSSIELGYAILHDAPRPLDTLRGDLPDGLTRGIGRCLEKSAADRFPSARDLHDVLRAASAAAPSKPAAAASVTRSATEVGTARVDEGFWVAVLPFRCTSSDADAAALAEGITEEVVTGLSRFSYLRVLSRSATSQASPAQDVRAEGRRLGARYVMEGSLRRAGSQLRVTVQLVDSETGVHLWAESYSRSFAPEEVFAVQDDLVARIVSTCADHFGVLARAISEVVRNKPLAELTPYEALMRGFGYHFRLSTEEHAEARDALERAVQEAPSNADCLSMLSWVYAHEHAHGFNPRPGSLDRALDAALRAVDLAPSNHLAQQVLAVARFFRKETAACRSAAERALALNPLDGSNEAIFILCFLGDWERGRALIRRSMELNPHHPRWYLHVLALDEYRKGNYREAVQEVIRANLPDLYWSDFLLAAAYGQLGELADARKALEAITGHWNDLEEPIETGLAKWYEPELCEHLIEGLRKAGLELGESGR